MKRKEKNLFMERHCRYLSTIEEDSQEYDTEEISVSSLTPENSLEDFQLEEGAQQLKTLLRLTLFEVQNVKKRVNLLAYSFDCVKQNIAIIQESQLQTIDFIVRM
ncbi:Hypothetical_protein [Hexamita inflata]|uniref:Hypothetical_protein n=1 Tax=Hexamita inflata TaxID=28002 RepID=A0AA86TN76_9EUKA|nr:Hypothetical protein HINF_LOCUS10156 [Hexamita inflata]CAI9922523.1 Hypothetical protein HINF_LOCUS10168 [Hexamita inflata]CAI9967028.1 Hypothetical protein HINF_LOCUS54673 [Hexamita inflata]